MWEGLNIQLYILIREDFRVSQGLCSVQYIQLCFNTSKNTTFWQHLEIGIMAVCTISPLALPIGDYKSI